MAGYYVYSLSYPDGTPFYIGKGKGGRINDHGTTRGRLASVNEVFDRLSEQGAECVRRILRDGLSEEEAFALEAQIISEIGRTPNGPLVNANDGGHGGRNPKQSTREKIRAARLAQPNPPRAHMVEMNRRRGPITVEQRAKISASLTGRVVSDEARKAMSIAAKSRPPPSRERMVELNRKRIAHTSEATREKLRTATKNQIWTDERRAKISAAQKGRKSDPAANEKRSAALKGRQKTPEHLSAIALAKAAKRAALEMQVTQQG